MRKLEARLQSAARKGRDLASANEDMIFSVAVPAVLGLARSKGKVLPTVGGYHPMLVWGLPLALLGERTIGGKWGKRARAAGIGMLACAANDAGHRGTLKVAGDEIGADDDDEIGADDDDDD